MAASQARVRLKAAKHVNSARDAMARYKASGGTDRRSAARFLFVVGRAEGMLCRVIGDSFDDIGPRVALVELMLSHSVLAQAAGSRGNPLSVRYARAALWASDVPLLGNPRHINESSIRSLMEEPPIESEFVREGYTATERLLQAADVCLTLAEHLARVQPPPPDRPISPRLLDSILRSCQRLDSTDLELAQSCQYELCSGADFAVESRHLTAAASLVYEQVIRSAPTMGIEVDAEFQVNRNDRCHALFSQFSPEWPR